MENSKIKLAILDSGRFAIRRILPQLKKVPQFDLVAIHNRTLSKAQELALEYQIGYATNSEKSLLDFEGLEAVIILSPNFLHKENIVEALKRNLAVFVEKPITSTIHEAEEVLAFLKPSHTLVVGHCYRFKNVLIEARNFIKEGHLGDLISFHICMNMNITKIGWRFQNRFGGGVSLELGIHVIDSIRFLSEQEFKSVFAIGQYLIDDEGEKVDISVHVLGELEQNVPVSLSYSFDSPYKTEFSVIGTKGELHGSYALRGDDDGKEKLHFHDLYETKTELLISKQNIYFEELNHFSEVIQGAISRITPQNAARNLEVVEAIKNSIKNKKREELTPSLLLI